MRRLFVFEKASGNDATPKLSVSMVSTPQTGMTASDVGVSHKLLSIKEGIVRQLKATFFPAGYPNSVNPGYDAFVGWQCVHHAAGSANGALASAFLLYGVGLGAEVVVPTAGAINWVLKDGLGQLGTLLFGRGLAPHFDRQTKTWYVLAALKLNIAMGMELCTAVCPGYFLVIASTANALKGLTWMAAGSTRAAFNVSFMTTGNIADITAKATSQTILTSLVGTTCGVTLCTYVGQDLHAATVTYLSLAAVHMFSAYQCVLHVPLASLNSTRLHVLMAHWHQQHSTDTTIDVTASLPSPSEVAKLEGVPYWTQDSHGEIEVGFDIDAAITVSEKNASDLAAAFETHQDDEYIVAALGSKVGLLLKEGTDNKTVLQGYFNAYLLRKMMATSVIDARDSAELIKLARARTQNEAGDFVNALELAGWNVDRILVSNKTHDHSLTWGPL